jgi:hypothetical protein
MATTPLGKAALESESEKVAKAIEDGSLIAIPAWVLTTDALVAVTILTIIEVLGGFLSTYRKRSNSRTKSLF